jgi:predicted NBD/HSP70 family sugar kinase
MRISWLSAEEISAARAALTAEGATWESHFRPEFAIPTPPEDTRLIDWAGVTEHVARAERVSQVVRDYGLDEARIRFAGATTAIEAATLAAAAHEGDVLALDEVIRVLERPIDNYVFYAPFLELLVGLGKRELDRTVAAYEQFVTAYAYALARVPHGKERIGAVKDGLADFYVSAGRVDSAEALFEQRHDEDQGDVAVALSASRAFLAAGSVSHAVRWLGVGAARASALGREELAERLRQKQEAVRKRLS